MDSKDSILTMADAKVLSKKIKKVKQLLASIEEDKGTDSKEYRAYQRKLEEYNSQIESAGAEESEHDDNNSVMTGDLSLDEDLDQPASSRSLGSVDTLDVSIDGSGRKELKDVDDYDLIRKKLAKVQRILKDLEEEHGEDAAKQRKDYAKYLKKQEQYSAILEGENKKEEASGSDDISASGISLEGDESDKNPDMQETQAKYDKVKNILKQLEKKFGKQDAKKRDDYQKYEKKKWKYFAILDKHDNKDASSSSLNQKNVNIIIAGAPASGKGTQCEVIKEKFGVVHLSTGDMLRAAVAAGTDVGKKAKDFMDSGKLVPDEVIIAIVSISQCTVLKV